MSSDEIIIPTEILYDILRLLCDGQTIALHDLKNESHFHEFPWAVGQVCRHWRGAFLSYSHLWTSFTLKPGTFSAAYFAEMNRRATIYLERSEQRPLTIVVSMPCRGTEKFPKTVWKMLLSCLKRWKKANLVLGNGAARDELLRRRGYMSSIESLTMSTPDDMALKNYNGFQVGPHLTELDLAQLGYKERWQFPWAQLTKLKIVVFDHYGCDLWRALRQLKNIEQLTIIITSPWNRFLTFPFPTIRLPSLRLLEITLAFAKMFSWFTAPLLEHLHIHGYGHWDRYFHNNQPYEREITSLIQRSSCHIRRLALEKCRTEEMRTIVKTLASVEELSIDYPSSLDIIQDITGLDGRIYLPKLQVLQVTCTLNGVEALKSAVTNFSRLLEARGKGLSQVASRDMVPLEKFVLRLTLQGTYPAEVLAIFCSNFYQRDCVQAIDSIALIVM
ncbi:hypothetical protein F5887DRAFT_1287729 [Amanita rubescens]|nr:hypothetical protein F5887DRAFT_1287729 [Amanita rubescens]